MIIHVVNNPHVKLDIVVESLDEIHFIIIIVVINMVILFIVIVVINMVISFIYYYYCYQYCYSCYLLLLRYYSAALHLVNMLIQLKLFEIKFLH